MGPRDSSIVVHARPRSISRGVVAHIDPMMRVMSTLWRASVLVYRGLHLLENVVDLLEVILGSQVGHGRQIIVLGQGSVRGPATDRQGGRSGSHVLGGQAPGVEAERGV